MERACWTADTHSLLMRGVLIQHNTTEQTISFIQGGLDHYKTRCKSNSIRISKLSVTYMLFGASRKAGV